MSPTHHLEQLLATSPTPETTKERFREIEQAVLEESLWIKSPDFDVFHSDDLEILFDCYDRLFFDRLIRPALGQIPIFFRLSKRMTRSGGKTTRLTDRRTGKVIEYEITISSTLLFGTFENEGETALVVGTECRTRIEALLRIFEHELIHLVEMLVWGHSSCSRPVFQSIARRFFGHCDYRHSLMTPQRRAIEQFGIRPGAKVKFHFEHREYTGIINRITKRATVLVEDSSGQRYSNGKRYSKFYIPLEMLEQVE